MPHKGKSTLGKDSRVCTRVCVERGGEACHALGLPCTPDCGMGRPSAPRQRLCSPDHGGRGGQSLGCGFTDASPSAPVSTHPHVLGNASVR